MKYFTSRSKLKLGVVAAVAVAVLGGVSLLQRSLAATGQLYFSPSSASVQKDNNLTLAVRINPGTAVDGVEATVTYDQSKLQFVSVDAGGSAFPVQLQQSGGGGNVQLSRGILGGSVSSSALVAKVTFKALAGSGSTNVSVSGNATSGGGYTDPSGGSASVALTSPTTSTPTQPKPTTPSEPSKPSSGDSSSGSNDSSSSDGGDTSGADQNDASGEKPTEQAGKVEICNRRIEFTRVILCVSANKRVRAYVKYGSAENQLRLNSKATGLGTKHDISLDKKHLIPGTTYYFQVIAEDEAGNKTVSSVQNFKTKGYHIRLLIRDRSELPLKHKKVTLFSEPQTSTTDDKGYVTFQDVAPGNHHIEYEQGGTKYSQPVTVEEAPVKTNADGSQTAETYGYNVIFHDLAAVSYTPAFVMPAIIAAAILAVVAAGTFIIMKRAKAQKPFATVSSPTAPPPETPIQRSDPNDLINNAPGPQAPDPGSVVTPKRDDNEDQK
jgi:cohesin domain-containing protein